MLKKGTVMPMPDIKDKLPERSFLPRSISSKLPFSTSKISELKRVFHAGDNSTMETMIVETLKTLSESSNFLAICHGLNYQVLAAVELSKNNKDRITTTPAFNSFKNNYLLVYSLMMGCIQVAGFCAFEACVRIFWPSIIKMRSQYIPEEAKSTIMNFFRIPLNIFACIVLYNVNAFPITVMFGMCSIFLFVACLLQRRLMVIADKPKTQDWTSLKEKDTEADPLNI